MAHPVFQAGQPVSVTGGPGAVGVIDAIDAGANTIRLTEATSIPDGTAVTIRLLTATRQIPAEEVRGGGTQLILVPTNPGILNASDILRVRNEGTADGGAVRRLGADPTVGVEISEALTGGTTAGLGVTRMIEDNTASLTGAALQTVRTRLTYTGVPPVAVGEEVLIQGGNEQTIARIDAIDGSTVILDQAQKFPDANTVLVFRVSPTGGTVADASLDEGLVMIPSAMDEEPTTRQRALQNHEMRHVFQEALWGPFFISMPIPWLFHLGFAIDDATADRRSKIMRHISLGGIDSLLAWLWGIFTRGDGDANDGVSLTGTVQADRRNIVFAESSEADKIAEFSDGTTIDLKRESFEDIAIVDNLNAGSRTIRLKFEPNETRFPAGAEVTCFKSFFEETRKNVDKYFSLDLEPLWADHIPVAWGRALSKLLSRDGWFPGIGLYLLGFYFTGGDDRRSPFEQDAAFHSGDLYTSIPLSEPTEVFVGEFSRIVGFVQARTSETIPEFAGVSGRGNPTALLTVRVPAGGAVTDVSGGADNGTSAGRPLVRLRENWLLRFNARVENVVGGLFAASRAGTYDLRIPGQLDEDVIFAGAMPTGFTERNKVVVKNLVSNPPTSQDVFETERVDYRLTQSDNTATYALRFPGGAVGNGQIDGMKYTAPLHATATSEALEITATYPANHTVFSGPGQEGRGQVDRGGAYKSRRGLHAEHPGNHAPGGRSGHRGEQGRFPGADCAA